MVRVEGAGLGVAMVGEGDGSVMGVFAVICECRVWGAPFSGGEFSEVSGPIAWKVFALECV